MATISAALVRDYVFGKKVSRPTAVLPATGQAAIFTIAGGRVEIVRIVGEVTTVCSATATNLSIIGNPTVGTDVAVCGVLAIASKEVGTLFGVTGLFSDALVGANAGALSGQQRPFTVPVGTLDLLTSATNTGQVKWSIWYRPIDDGATVTAA